MMSISIYILIPLTIDFLTPQMDLVGGYYDAGDNVKFNFPMAFTVTTLAWSVIEFGQSMGSEQQNALDAVRWGSDYLLKSTSVPDVVVGVVGDPNGDHSCSERPEDMDTPRTTYVVNKTSPGTEVAAETAAALAASSIAFRGSDDKYSEQLLARARQVIGLDYPFLLLVLNNNLSPLKKLCKILY